MLVIAKHLPSTAALQQKTAQPQARPFFTTRQGGCSQGGYESFNLAQHVGDQAEVVSQNRHQLMALFGLPPEKLVLAQQIHSTKVAIVDAPWQNAPLPEVDALVTCTPDLLIGVMVADCAPLLLADAKAGVIAAVHAGWRGALGGIASHTLQHMQQLGAKMAQTHAWLGPCLRQPAFEVGAEFISQLLTQHAHHSQFLTPPAPHTGKAHFNLPGYLLQQLIDNGILLSHINDVGLCTYANPKQFFSYRRNHHLAADAPCGRQMGGIFFG